MSALPHKPRVLHVVPAAFGLRDGVLGGAERYALELAKAMARLTPTTLLAFGDEPREERVDELRLVVLRGRPVRGQRTNPWARALPGWVARADVVHCHQRSVVASSVAALTGRLTARPVFVSDLGGGGWDLSTYVDTVPWFAGHLHISEFSRRAYGHADRDDAHVILGGVDTERFRPDPAVEKTDEVIYVGRLLPHKGINYLVEAAAGCFPLRLIGTAYDARFRADLERLAPGEVAFSEGLDDTALVRAYQAARVTVLPSVHTSIYGQHSPVPELLGQTPLESMACGTPAVVTRTASLPEVCRHGETGFVVNPNDAGALRERIRWLLDHPAEAARMGQAGRAWVEERFQWRSVAERCLEHYARALQTADNGPRRLARTRPSAALRARLHHSRALAPLREASRLVRRWYHG